MRKFITSDQKAVVEKISSMGLNRALSDSTHKTAMQHTGTGAILYAKNVIKDKPGNEVFVNVACSSYEYYGCNSNGDGFPSEKAYPEFGIEEKDLLVNNYKSFESAKVYSMHDMNIPIGKVHKAFWNNTFKWVELVVELFEDKLDEETLLKVRSGEMIFFSMGCDVEYDACTICGHHSYGSNYCEHVKDHLLEIIDGVVTGMLNPSPKFDDISSVFIPADAIAVSLYRKVAAAGSTGKPEFVSDISRKTAKKCDNKNTVGKLKKIGEIYKDTRRLKAIDRVGLPYQDLKGGLNTGLNQDELEDVFSFFFKNRLPLPVLGILSKYNIKTTDFIKAQDTVISAVLDNDNLREQFEQASEGITTDVLDRITGQINQLDGLEPKARALAVFNIINKLKISEEGIDNKYLPEGSPEVKDVQTVIQLEFLGGRE